MGFSGDSGPHSRRYIGGGCHKITQTDWTSLNTTAISNSMSSRTHSAPLVWGNSPEVAMRPLTEPDLKISLIRLLKHILYGFRLYNE